MNDLTTGEEETICIVGGQEDADGLTIMKSDWGGRPEIGEK